MVWSQQKLLGLVISVYDTFASGVSKTFQKQELLMAKYYILTIFIFWHFGWFFFCFLLSLIRHFFKKLVKFCIKVTLRDLSLNIIHRDNLESLVLYRKYFAYSIDIFIINDAILDFLNTQKSAPLVGSAN